MSVWTLIGPLSDKVGAARVDDEFLSVPSLRYAPSQPRGVPLLHGHSWPHLGTVRHLELDAGFRGELMAVATADRLDGCDGWFFSPAVVYEGDGPLTLRELSITKHPASSGLRGVTVLPGDYRDA